MDKAYYGIYTSCTPKFQRGGLYELSRTVKANQHDASVIELIQIGQLEGTFESSGRVYSSDGLAPTLNTMGGGNREPKISEPTIAAMRGRDANVLTPKRTEYGKIMRKSYESREYKESRHTMQQLEPRDDGVTNTLTTVQKDNLVLEPHYRIRKLTPKECWRLMGFSDEDFEKARAALNERFYKGKDKSSSQLYKQAGNSIVVQVLMAIKKQMIT